MSGEIANPESVPENIGEMSINSSNGGLPEEKAPQGGQAKAKVVFVDEKDAPREADDLFPSGPMPEPRMKDSELVRKMSTIKGSVKREGSQSVPTDEFGSAADIEVIQEDDKVYITCPWQKIVEMSVLQEAISKKSTGYFAEMHIDLQGSTLRGDAFDGISLSEMESCTIFLENGVLEFKEMKNLQAKSKLTELDILAGVEGCIFTDCNLDMEGCSVIGKGTLTLASSAVLRMVDCEVTEAEKVGVCVDGGNLSAKRSKFVDHGEENMLIQDGGVVTITQCDFIGSKGGEGLSATGKGTSVTITKSTFINNETSNLLVSDRASATMEDTVCFNSQTLSGFEIRGKGTKVKLVRCEFLNSHLHGVSVASGADLTAEDLLCRGSQGCGLTVQGKGSKATVVSSIFADNIQNGVAVTTKAVCVFRGCTMSGSKSGAGIEVGGYGADLNMMSCKISGNCASGIIVREGALAALRDCVSSNSKMGCGLEVDGAGTEVWVTRGEYGDNEEGGVIVNEGRVID